MRKRTHTQRTHTLLAHVQYASWMCVCVCMIIYIHIYTHTYKYIIYIYIYIPRAKPHTPSHQLNPKPSKPSCTALRRLFRSCSSLVYSGKSSWLKHVCDEGSLFLSPHRWMLNFCQTPQRQHGSSRTPSPTSSLPSPHFALPSLLQKPLQAQVRTMHAPITTAAYLWTVHAAERLEALHGHLRGASHELHQPRQILLIHALHYCPKPRDLWRIAGVSCVLCVRAQILDLQDAPRCSAKSVVNTQEKGTGREGDGVCTTSLPESCL